MNAIFSETMQDTETQILQFIVEGTANSNMVSNCQYNIYLVHVLFTIEMLVFILQLKKFLQKLCEFILSAALKSSKVFLNVPKTCFSGVDDFLIDIYDLS